MSIQLVDSKGKLQDEKSLRTFIASLVSCKTSSLPFLLEENDGTDAAFHKTTTKTELPELDEVSANTILQNVGANYHVVGVFGGQSSGKSTLLNYLFGTNFTILDESIRRGQTTIGAFLSRATMCDGKQAETSSNEVELHKDVNAETEAAQQTEHHASKSKQKVIQSNNNTKECQEELPSSCFDPLIIVDFEGTDGFERGENQSFERQLSLFGLSMADTLIINMWAVDVGRFNAANLGLLRTIFEINLQLFSHDNYEKAEKPTLLVVIRDFLGETEAPSLATLKQSFQTIWEGINRTNSKYENSSIEDMFHFKFYFLPHYKLQQELFQRRVTELQKWFCDCTNAHYLFHHRKMFRNVPLDGLVSYLTSCWEVIRSSKDLDIPTQREMLARHRCEEIKRQELSIFDATCAMMRNKIHQSSNASYYINANNNDNNITISKENMLLEEEFSFTLRKDAVMCVRRFDEHTRLYSPQIVMVFRAELCTELNKARLGVINEFAHIISTFVMNALQSRLQSAIDRCVAQVIKRGQSIPFTSTITSSSSIPQAMNKTSTAYLSSSSSSPSLLLTSPSPTAFQVTSNTTTATTNAFAAGLNTASSVITQYEMNNNAIQSAVMEFYTQLQQEMSNLLSDVRQTPHALQLYGLYSTSVDRDELLSAMTSASVAHLLVEKVHHKLTAMAEAASETIHHAFEMSLHHSVDGVVQFFTSTQTLAKATPGAQQAGLVLLSCLLYFRLAVHTSLLPTESNNSGNNNVININSTVIANDNNTILIKNECNTTVAQGANEKITCTFDANDDYDVCLINKLQSLSIQVRSSNDESQFFLSFTTLDVNPVYPTLWMSRSKSNREVSNKSLSHAEKHPRFESSHHDNSPNKICDKEKDNNDITNNKDSYNTDNSHSSSHVNNDKDGRTLCNYVTCDVLEHLLLEEPQGVQVNNILLNEAAVQRAVEIYRQRCEFTLQLQVRSIESNRQRLPTWVLPTLLALGWNWIWYLISSPVLLLLVIVNVVFFFHGFIQSQWQAYQANGPAMIVIPLQNVVRYVKTFFDNVNNNINSINTGNANNQNTFHPNATNTNVTGISNINSMVDYNSSNNNNNNSHSNNYTDNKGSNNNYDSNARANTNLCEPRAQLADVESRNGCDVQMSTTRHVDPNIEHY